MNTREEINNGLLTDSVLVTQSLLKDILSDMSKMEDFSPEREFHLNQQIMKLTLGISSFVEVTTLLSKFVTKMKLQPITEIKDSHVHLLSIMKGIQHAQSKLDHVALEDLIKYELKDNLTQWNIDLLPQIKRLLSA